MSDKFYTLEKVVDPHKHMTKEIKETFWKATEFWDMNNNSFVKWTVGSYEVLQHSDDSLLKKVDDWLSQHFVKGEKIIILYWW